jgi:CRISPR-associated endonuclease/helicase Cas3
MVISESDFAQFFAAVNHGREPFAWQTRLLSRVVVTGHWPDVIDAPTGSGKSSVLEVHVFANAVAASRACENSTPPRPPRRLVVTVDRRALVDGHAERGEELARLLREVGDDDSVVAAVAAALCAMRAEGESDGEIPLLVSRIRGGIAPDRTWLDSPTACQIIAGTPDMIGSRLLFNGYGSSRFARPREAGLMAFNTAIVIDEAHLNRQLVTTARQVTALVKSEADRLGASPLEVCAMTATQSDGIGQVVGVRAEDLEQGGPDQVLTARLTRPKPVTLVPTDSWPGNGGAAAAQAEAIAELVTRARSQHGPTVGCVVNTVNMALAVSQRLKRKRVVSGAGADRTERPLDVVTLVGPMRPVELAAIRAEHPGLYTLEGDPSVDVLVATQTIEVGVDLDFSALVTELASGSAIAQRAGRVNRAGNRDSAPVIVVTPPDGAQVMSQSGPYQDSELAESLGWLTTVACAESGLAPWSLHAQGGGAVPPAESLRRPAMHRPEVWNVLEWARTGDERIAEPWLDLWLSDRLDPDLTMGIVVRSGLPSDPEEARQQILATPPLSHEVFPVRPRAWAAIINSEKRRLDRAFVWRAGTVRGARGAGLKGLWLHPGDTVILDSAKGISRAGVITYEYPDGADPEDVGELPALSPTAASRRWVRLATGAPCLIRGGKLLPGAKDLLTELSGLAGRNEDDALAAPEEICRAIAEWLATLDEQVRCDDRLQLLARVSQSKNLQIITPPRVTEGPEENADFWVVLAGRDASADDEASQVWQSGTAVDLDIHQLAVGSLAESFGISLGMNPDLVRALSQSGRLHDEGKRDPRFQRSLVRRERDPADRVLAKSGMRSLRAISQARAASGLPRGWRHEQLSAALVWDQSADSDAQTRDLVTRLVGTSHGRGRHEYPHAGGQLTDNGLPSAGALALFDDAEWELVLERTHGAWGFWGCAYLEAILRAADANVSRRQS